MSSPAVSVWRHSYSEDSCESANGMDIQGKSIVHINYRNTEQEALALAVHFAQDETVHDVMILLSNGKEGERVARIVKGKYVAFGGGLTRNKKEVWHVDHHPVIPADLPPPSTESRPMMMETRAWSVREEDPEGNLLRNRWIEADISAESIDDESLPYETKPPVTLLNEPEPDQPRVMKSGLRRTLADPKTVPDIEPVDIDYMANCGPNEEPLVSTQDVIANFEQPSAEGTPDNSGSQSDTGVRPAFETAPVGAGSVVIPQEV